jgi:anti-sigma regulatory factor (Ser/Thr protein kinase)
MFELLGADQASDDIAVLMLMRLETPAAAPLELHERAEPAVLRPIRNALRQWMSDARVPPPEAEEFLVAVGEACANVVEHAYGPGGGPLSVRLEAETGGIVAVVRDHGRWRSPRGHNRGRGSVLMRGCADEVDVEHLADGTLVTLRKSVPVEEAG